MDKEGASLILKWDREEDLEDVLLNLVFDFKGKLNSSPFHPKLLDQRLTKLKNQIEAYQYLTQVDFLSSENYLTDYSFPSDKLEAFNYFENCKSNIKQKLYSESNPTAIVELCLQYKTLYIGWWEELIDGYEFDDVKENKELDQMSMLSQLTLWKASTYDVNMLQNDNFAPLKKELDRISKILSSYV